MKLYRASVSNTITPLLLLQVGIVVIGCLAVKMTMKVMGYNSPSGELLLWSSNCIGVRDWGFLFLLIPTTFVFLIIRDYHRYQSQYISRKLIILCGITTICLLIYFLKTYLDANSPYDSGMINSL